MAFFIFATRLHLFRTQYDQDPYLRITCGNVLLDCGSISNITGVVKHCTLGWSKSLVKVYPYQPSAYGT